MLWISDYLKHRELGQEIVRLRRLLEVHPAMCTTG